MGSPHQSPKCGIDTHKKLYNSIKKLYKKVGCLDICEKVVILQT